MYFNNRSRIAAEKILQTIKEEKGKITYPIDPFEILRKNNVVITFSDFDKLEGLLLFDKQKESIVSINLNRPITRQRFTAAHELGHIMLHTEINGDNFLCPILGAKNHIEREADDFASYLLMPNDELNKIIDMYQNQNGFVDLDACLLIAEYFGVSFESCVKTIRFRLNRLVHQLNNTELNKIIRKYKPQSKRKKLFENTNDLNLLRNSINYSYFSIPNVNEIVGIRFMQNLVYHDNRLENIDLSIEKVNEIYADFRINGSGSKFCTEENQNIIEVLGNIEMNKYCLETSDDITIFKIKDLNKLLYKFVPYPEYTGTFRTTDNLILRGKIQPISISELFNKIEELNELVNKLVVNIDEYDISDYIREVANIHYKLTVLHPFNDGNGRISRAFMNWLLRLKGLCPIYIDSENRDVYLDSLSKIDSGDDTTELQIIIIKSIIKTMAELHNSWR
ncbi:MAG: ImmA/IrrE family metallo-endopeptidase [Firmicutes bacterium]|nr:ImmA/IrrE family metallo-endopeptidase [Bacillota bacterium]